MFSISNFSNIDEEEDIEFMKFISTSFNDLYKLIQEKRTRQAPSKKKNRIGEWSKYFEELSDIEFVERHRVSKTAFETIVKAVDEIYPNDKSRSKYKKPVERDVSLTLRFLAGSRDVDIVDLYGVSRPTVPKTVVMVCEMITMKFGMKHFDMENKSFLKSVEQDFAELSALGVLRGCVGAIDGVLIETCKPREIYDGINDSLK